MELGAQDEGSLARMTSGRTEADRAAGANRATTDRTTDHESWLWGQNGTSGKNRAMMAALGRSRARLSASGREGVGC